MKLVTSLIGALALFALSAPGAVYWNKFTTNANPAAIPLISASDLDSSVDTYVMAIAGTTEQVGTNVTTTTITVYSNAYFLQTNFVAYNFTTNLTVVQQFNVLSNAYFYSTNFNNYEITTNLNVIQQFTVQSNAYFFSTNFVNYEIVTNLTVQNVLNVTSNAYFYQTNFVNYDVVTNLTVLSNAYFTQIITTNLYATNITAKNLHVTENIIYAQSTPTTNAWAGPTNTIPLHIADQNYLALTPCSITGLTSKSNDVSQHVLLRIRNNNSGSNITLYVPAEWRTGDYASSYTISNNALGVISIEYTPTMGEMSNAVFRDFN